MQELLVEKIVCESVRFGRLLSYEQQEFSRRGAFFGLAVDRVLRYQTAVNKQLFQAVRQLEDLQAKHKAQSPGPEQEDCALGNGEVAPHDLGAGGVTESEPNSESQLETSVQDSSSPVPVEEDSALPLLSSLVDSGTYHHEPDLTKNCGTNPPHHPKEEEVQSDSLGNACPEG